MSAFPVSTASTPASWAGQPSPGGDYALPPGLPWAVLCLASDGTVRYLSPAAEALWGVPAAQVLGCPLTQVEPAVLPNDLLRALVPPPPAPQAEASAEYWLPFTRRWILMRTAPEAAGQQWVYWDDITARKETQPIAGHLLEAIETVAQSGHYEVDLITQTVRFSDGMYRLFGEAPQSFTPTQEFVDARSHPDDAAAVRRVLSQAVADKRPYHYLRRILRADGQQRTVEAHGTVLCDAAGTPVKLAGLVQDVTERQRAEQQVRESRLLLQATLDNSLDYIQVFRAVRDEQGQIIDFTWLLTNQQWTQVFGDPTGQRLLEHHPDIVQTGLFEKFVEVTETGIPQQHEQYYRSAQFNGWFYQAIVRLDDGFVLTTEDISTRKKAEQELLRVKEQLAQQATDRYQSLFMSMDEGFCVVEVLFDAEQQPQDFCYIDTNPVFERQSGLQQVLGRTARELLPDLEPFWLDLYGQVALLGHPTRVVAQAQAVGRWFDVHAFRVGRPECCQVAVLFKDVTEAKQREASLALLAEISEDFTRLTSIPELLTTIGDKLYQQLGASRVMITDIQEAADTIEVVYEKQAPDLLPSPTQVQRLSEYVPEVYRREYRAHAAVVVADTRTDPRTADHYARYQARGIGSLLSTPFTRQQEWCFAIGVHKETPYQWRPDEQELVQAVTERLYLQLARVRAEEALRASEARFRQVADLVPDLLWSTTADGASNWCNQRWLDYTGLTEAETLNQGWLRAVHPADRAQSWQNFQAAVTTGQPLRQEHRLGSAAGSFRWFLIQALPFYNKAGQIEQWFGAATDIHDRKMAEQAILADKQQLEQLVAERTRDLQESSSLLQSIFDTSLMGMLVLEPLRDEAGSIQDFRIRLANREVERETGRTDLTGKRCAEEYPGIRPTGLFDLMLTVLETGEPRGTEYYYGHDGFDKWFSCMIVQLDDGLVVTNLDITERKQAEQRLRHNQELLESVFNSSLSTMAVLRTLRNEQGRIDDFEIILADPSIEASYLGHNPVGLRYSQLHPLLHESPVYEQLVAAVETGQRADFEVNFAHEAGSLWFRFVVVKLADGVVVATENITARKQAEQERAKSLQLLEQSEEVAAMGSWDYDLTTGHLQWSAGLYRLFALDLGSAVSPRTYLDYVVEDDRAVAEQYARYLLNEPVSFEQTLRVRVTGQVKTLRIKAELLLDADGQPRRLLGVDLDISQVRRLEAENLNLRLQQQRKLFHAVLEAQEAERKRIAESLHNGVGQLLYATKLHLDQLHAPGLGAAPAVVVARREADHLLSEAIRQTRVLSHELVPMVLQEFGLEAALHDIGRQLSSPQLLLRCCVTLDEEVPPLSLPLQLALYRIAQELGQNIIKHAHGATEASIALETVPGFVLLRAEDDGPGFAPAATAHSPGLGLRSIHDRVALLGGTVEIGSSPEYGTYVRIRIPVPSSSAAHDTPVFSG